ncbi:MAG: class I SAM-dependent methyltransferase [Thermoguttaceae bacterium]
MPLTSRPQWQLPRGVPRGVWDYSLTPSIAGEYDRYFACNQLFEFDEQVIARHFTRPGLVADFGCGTGRALIPLTRRGFQTLGIDLSGHMLRVVRQKAEVDHLEVMRLRANLVELDCLRDDVLDYGICLFSTLGMIRGRQNRHRFLAHVHRALKPAGLLVLHVHNYWFNLFDRLGRRWILRNCVEVAMNREIERGDKFFDYRGVPKMFLHTFARRELVGLVRGAGFRIVDLTPLNLERTRRLPQAWFLGSLRANGWILVAEKS